MTGRIITCDHTTYDLPALLEWNVTYTGTVPCDSFSVTCLHTADLEPVLRRAAGFLLLDGSEMLLRAIVDEYEIRLSAQGMTALVTGRGYAARLLDNESRPAVYQDATLAEIVRSHVTPYGISCAKAAAVRANGTYTVESGSSQWKALENFCRTYGSFAPRFERDGRLIAAPETDSGKRLVLDEDAPLLALTKRENHYGVLSEVLVIDKTRNQEYTVKNADFLSRGGQCRRVLYTPGQSTWAAMRYTGEYQIARSAEDEVSLEATLTGGFLAFPGDIVQLSIPKAGLAGEYRVAEAENRMDEFGEQTVLTLKERT